MSDIPEINEENIEQYSEAIGQVVESLTKMKVSYAALGVALGAAVGGVIGFAIAHRKAEKKYNEIAENEISEMRDHYAKKLVASENTILKPQLEQIVEEKGYGYTDSTPMAITPPQAVVDAAEEVKEEPELKPAPGPGDVVRPPTSADEVHERRRHEQRQRNVFQERERITHQWDYHEEKTRRSPLRPYVIHFDEREEGYDEMTLTLYEADDILCRDDDSIIDGEDRERLVGEKNLDRFGHGSQDANIVYIRNDVLEMQFEICKSPNSYAEEVHGLTHSEYGQQRNHPREHFDDE